MATRDRQDTTTLNGSGLMEALLLEMEKGSKLMWQSSDLIVEGYRIYLLDCGRIKAADSYPAKDEATAIGIASSLFAACSDTFSGYELWHGRRRLLPGERIPDFNERDDPDDAAALEYQALVLSLEERLQDTFDCVRRSRRLVETARLLRERLNRCDHPGSRGGGVSN